MILEFHLAFGEIEEGLDQSTGNPFLRLLADKDTQFIHLVELYPYDEFQPGTMISDPPMGMLAFGEYEFAYGGGTAEILLSDTAFTTTPTDAIPNQHYKPLVNNPVEFDTAIMSGTEFGGGSLSFGSIVIENGDGELDQLARYVWNGRRAVVKVGVKGMPYEQFTTIFEGATNDLSVSDERITLGIQDNRIRTDQLLAAPLYAGTGGLEGGESLSGRPKPLCLGEVKNIAPVLVDPVNLVYQVHDGSVMAVDTVRDSGAVLTDGGDTSDIESATPAAGEYMTQLSGGYIKLGATPAGRVSADVRGENAGGYVSSAGGLIIRLLTTRLTVRPFTMAEIDGGALARIDQAVRGPMGLYLTEAASASDTIDALLLPCLAYWNFSRTGNLTGGVVQIPKDPTLELTADDIDIEGVERIATIVPSWRISVGYAPLGVVQEEDELADATTEEDRAFLGSEYRFATFQDDTIRARYDTATDRTFYTRLARREDAQALLERLKDIYMVSRKIIRVPLHGMMYRAELGETARLSYPRASDGADFMTIGISENAETGETVLGLWG